ncbi:hypothetical protein ACTA71_007331 [Dictyostelium dimigraforme]
MAILLTSNIGYEPKMKNDENKINDEDKLVESICSDLGVLFQAQDDYLDCFSDPKFIGKTGTDIQENKCSWLICKAITLCNDDQLNQLKQNYGINNDLNVSKVKSVYNEINLQEHFQIFEKELFNSISEKLKTLSKTSNQKSEILSYFLNKIFKRNI